MTRSMDPDAGHSAGRHRSDSEENVLYITNHAVAHPVAWELYEVLRKSFCICDHAVRLG
jgi:hypothetical protein